MIKFPSSVRVTLPTLLLAFSLMQMNPAFGQQVQSIAEREVARRQANIVQGRAAIERAATAMDRSDFAKAHDEYRTAVNYLPDAVATARFHDQALDGFSKSGVKLSEQRIAEGKYTDAEKICKEILTDRYNPRYRPAVELLAHLEEPGYFNKTVGPKFVGRVEDVKKLLVDADGYYNTGRFDLAFKKYEQVLNLDPYNIAARRGQEKISHAKAGYGEAAYNETRARQLWQVQKGWEEPVRQYGQSVGPITDAFAKDAGGTARITTKLNTIILPRIDFRDATIREAIDFIRQAAAANDPSTEGKKGVDIVLRLEPIGHGLPAAPAPDAAAAAPAIPGAAPAIPETPIAAAPAGGGQTVAPSDARITITLNQIPLGEALRYISSQAGLKVKVEPYAVSIVPLSEQSADLITKEYRVPPGFISSSVNVGASALSQPAAKTGGGGGVGTVENGGNNELVRRTGAKEFLESQGVPFPQGASANFLPQSSRLVVRNTTDNLELVDALVEQATVSGPKQVEIESKFVEITQNNLKELGFDWLLGQFNLPGSQRIFAGGGTSGTGAATSASDFPFNQPGGAPVGTFPVTGGNRSGNLAISANAIDALLFGGAGASSLAPGIFGLSGVFTDPQFQLVVRALNQKKGVDLLSAPRVTTKSGQRAVIEIVREFRYPTQFEPPQIPQNTNANGGGGTSIINPLTGAFGNGGSSGAFPVTPTTPTGFETRNTGVTLEVEPVVGPDGVTIDLNLVPQVVEFEGFINYGSPIGTSSINALTGQPQRITLTDNVINQPIFSSRKVTTSVSVWDGQTVVLGGLMREDVQKTEDRTPIIGDIPIIGRLFRTNAEQRLKRNLVIFVTARLVNPAGQPLNQKEEEEEESLALQGPDVIEPPVLPQVPMYKK